MSSELPRPGRRVGEPSTTPQDSDNPFTDDDRVEMVAQLERLAVAERLIARSVRAGIDVTSLAEQARSTREQLTRLKNAFFPGQ